MSENKDYFKSNAEDLSLPVFLQPWWLDVVYEDNWDVVLIRENDSIKGVWVYSTLEINGMTVIKMPPLTQFQGIWLLKGNAKYSKELGKQKNYLQTLAKDLPQVDYLVQYIWPEQTNWLPLKWMGFEQTTRYTYQVNTGNIDDCWAEVLDKTRAEIRKASKNNISLEQTKDHKELLALHKMTFERQDQKYPYDETLFQNIIEQSHLRGSGKIMLAKDEEGKYHAGVFLLEDNNTIYYLIGGGDPDLRNSGATSFLVWEAIKYAHEQGKTFDFEGSMMEPIERFFRSFGARQIPYHALTYKSERYKEREYENLAKMYMKGRVKNIFGKK